MTFLDRLTSIFLPKSTPEGAYHVGPYYIRGPHGGVLPHEWGQNWNFWQMDLDPVTCGAITATVEACLSAYAQTVAMCPMAHWRELDDGGRDLVTTSALSRIARVPNDYQSRSDFLLNLVRSLYLDGNAYALAQRNDRFEVASLHLMNPRQCSASMIEGEIFYTLGGNIVIDDRDPILRRVPARDVLHVKLNALRDPLHGESPLRAAGPEIRSTLAALEQATKFFQNSAKPSGVISTDLKMGKEQIAEFKQLWNEATQGPNAGGTPFLTNGLKFQPITQANKDTQLNEIMARNEAAVAKAFRIPLAIIGSEQQPMGSTEALMNFWIAGGLGFAIDHVENAYDRLFRLPPGEYSELDTQVLLRSNLKEKLDAYAVGTINGIIAPDEARAAFDLGKVKQRAGEQPRVQQQVVPLSFALNPPAPPAPAAPPPAAAAMLQLDIAEADEIQMHRMERRLLHMQGPTT